MNGKRIACYRRHFQVEHLFEVPGRRAMLLTGLLIKLCLAILINLMDIEIEICWFWL